MSRVLRTKLKFTGFVKIYIQYIYVILDSELDHILHQLSYRTLGMLIYYRILYSIGVESLFILVLVSCNPIKP